MSAKRKLSPEKRLSILHAGTRKTLRKEIQTALRVGIEWEEIDDLVHQFKPVDPPKEHIEETLDVALNDVV